MNISEKRKSELYEAIKEPIMRLRISMSRFDAHGSPLTLEQIDARLFRLEQQIWAEVSEVLNIGETP